MNVYDFSLVFFTANNLPNRVYISEDNKKLAIENLCKDCIGDPDRTTDLMNIQCQAKNKHNYTFADAYLNVLGKSFSSYIGCHTSRWVWLVNKTN